MTSMVDFELDEKRLSDGIRLFLHDRDGVLTKDWIQVRSMHTDVFRAAMEKAKAKVTVSSDNVTEASLDAKVALVAGWSFDEDCTDENIRSFLQMAPHIADRIDKTAGDNRHFFSTQKTSSMNGSLKNSRSTKKQKATAQSGTH